MRTIIEMAREAGMAGFDGVVHAAFQLEAFADLVRADERERIKETNAPEIEKINTHIKSLEKAVTDEREWVGLTDEDIDKIYETHAWDERKSLARAIEAASRSKNT